MDTWPEPPLRYAAATVVVVGKTDILPPDERERTVARIRTRIRARNPLVPVIVARQGRIDPAFVFDTATTEEPDDELPIARLLRDTHARDDHEHVVAASVPLPGRLAPGALIDLLEDPPEGAYRIKGRIRVRGPKADRGYVVNVVGRMIHIAPLPEPPVIGELVAIGLHLDAAGAERRLREVALAPAERADAAGLRRLHRYRRLSD